MCTTTLYTVEMTRSSYSVYGAVVGHFKRNILGSSIKIIEFFDRHYYVEKLQR